MGLSLEILLPLIECQLRTNPALNPASADGKSCHSLNSFTANRQSIKLLCLENIPNFFIFIFLCVQYADMFPKVKCAYKDFKMFKYIKNKIICPQNPQFVRDLATAQDIDEKTPLCLNVSKGIFKYSINAVQP